MTEHRKDEALLILIHGTEDGPERRTTPNYQDDAIDDDGAKWWQRQSCFLAALDGFIAHPSGRSVLDGIVRFKWDGANSESERELAAHSLAELMRARGGAPSFIVAHSHGGNVARRAIAILGAERTQLIRNVHLACVATPFFTYAARFPLIKFATQLFFLFGCILLAASLVEIAWFPKTPIWHDEIYQGAAAVACTGVVAALIVPMAMAAAAAMSTVRRFFSYRASYDSNNLKPATWMNYFSEKDEAFALLTSLNERIRLFQLSLEMRPWAYVMLFIANLIILFQLRPFWRDAADIIATRSNVLSAAPNIFADFLRQIITHLQVFYASIAAIIATNVLIFLGHTVVRKSTQQVLDTIVTDRLADLAFGDDVDAGLQGVSPSPWPDAAEVCVPIPIDVHNELETMVAQAAEPLWGRMRLHLQPSTNLVRHDWKRIVKSTLTWSELAHTSYFRSPLFAAFLASEVIKSGLFVRRPTTGEASKAELDLDGSVQKSSII